MIEFQVRGSNPQTLTTYTTTAYVAPDAIAMVTRTPENDDECVMELTSSRIVNITESYETVMDKIELFFQEQIGLFEGAEDFSPDDF